MSEAPEGTRWLSASQIETFTEVCKRKWLFRYGPLRLLTVKKDHHDFGTIMHGAIESYLLSKPMWQDGWDVSPDTNKRADPADAALIRVLVEEGIRNGYIERRPGAMKPETQIEMIIHPLLRVTGKIDYATWDRIEDHKHSKSARYFKSSEALKKNVQLMLYAKWLIDEHRKFGRLPPPILTLVHNQFLKSFEEPTTRRREAEVTPLEVQTFWETVILPACIEMDALGKSNIDPFSLPDPPVDSCNAYGGCDYRSICSGGEKVSHYKKRIDRLLNPQPPQTAMTVLTPNAFLAGRGAAPAPNGAAVPINPPAGPAAPAAVAQPGVPRQPAPPWAWDACPLCAKKAFPGFSTESKKPCRVCLSSGNNRMSMADLEAGFTWSVDATGLITWSKRGVGAVASVPATAAPVDAGSKTAYGSQDLLVKIRSSTTVDAALAVLKESQTVLAGQLTELEVIQAAVEKRIDEIEGAPSSQPPPQPVTPPTPAAAPAPTPAPVASANPMIDLMLNSIRGAIPNAKTEGELQSVLQTAKNCGASDAQMTELAQLAQARMLQLAPPAPAAPAQVQLGPVTESAPRRRGRPRKNAAVAPADGAVQLVDIEEGLGLVLLIGCTAVKTNDRNVIMAEQFLGDIPGYWENTDVWKRRQELRAAIHRRDPVLKCLENVTLVQTVADPDVDNLMSTLIPHASEIIRGTL